MGTHFMIYTKQKAMQSVLLSDSLHRFVLWLRLLNTEKTLPHLLKDMCFDPDSPMHGKLKETLLLMMEGGNKD